MTRIVRVHYTVTRQQPCSTLILVKGLAVHWIHWVGAVAGWLAFAGGWYTYFFWMSIGMPDVVSRLLRRS